jgi:hypothetical protein
MKNTTLKVFIASMVLDFTATTASAAPTNCSLSNIKGHYIYSAQFNGYVVHGEAYADGKGNAIQHSRATVNCLSYTGGTGDVLNPTNNFKLGATCSYDDSDVVDTSTLTIVKDISSPCEFTITSSFNSNTQIAQASLRSSRKGGHLMLTAKSVPGLFPFVYRAEYIRE